MAIPLALAKTAAISLFLVCFSAIAISLPLPVKLRQLEGAWIGPSDSLAYFRLELDTSGRGLLVIQEDPDTGAISLYKVRGTGLVGHKIAFALIPIDGADPTVRLAGDAYRGEMSLIRRGINHGQDWSQHVSLERETDVLPRIRAVQEAAAAFGKRPER